MLNKESVNKARSLYYGFLSKLFVFTTSNDRYQGVLQALDVMIENPIDENSHEALKEIKLFITEMGENALVQEYDDIFHNPSYKVVRNTASYYDEGVESGKKRVEVINFLAKTRIRKNEASFKENEEFMEAYAHRKSTFEHIELRYHNEDEFVEDLQKNNMLKVEEPPKKWNLFGK